MNIAFRYVSVNTGPIGDGRTATQASTAWRPALLAAQRPGWEQVERDYRDALLHLRRAGETGDALTAANTAVESALKALGMKGNTLAQLLKSLRNSGLLAGHSAAILDSLMDLTSRLEAWRSSEGDAHGRAPGAVDPTRPLAALALHWAGSFIAYLATLADNSAP